MSTDCWNSPRCAAAGGQTCSLGTAAPSWVPPSAAMHVLLRGTPLILRDVPPCSIQGARA